MKVKLGKDAVCVLLEGKEQLWAVKKQVQVQAEHITNVEWMHGKVNRSRLGGVRAPGTGVPKLFYAGSIYRRSGWEFWYLNARQSGYLVITTDQKKYRVIRVTVSEKTGEAVREWFEELLKERRRNGG